MATPAAPVSMFAHHQLDCGIELALDPLPSRQTVALYFRMLGGVALDPLEQTGLSGMVERTLSRGTRRHDGPALADAFDRYGIQWGTVTGRQSMLVRCLCLPEYVGEAIDLVAELLTEPALRDDAIEVGLQLAREEVRHLEDEPGDLLRLDMQKLVMGPRLGRDPTGTLETLDRITPDAVRAHWKEHYRAGRLQVALAGPLAGVDVEGRLEAGFAGFGSATQDQRDAADFVYRPGRSHRQKDLKQEHVAVSLPGASRDSADDPIERVLLAILSGGMSGRLFSEVREKQGLAYSVGAWHEQPRGRGLLHMAASTTPERVQQTYETLLRELARIGEDLTAEETNRARNQLLAHARTEDDLTRARAMTISDDLFHHGRPIGSAERVAKIAAVRVADVSAYVARMPRDELCVTTVGPVELA